ncbi:MAG: ABC transporter ATP-binding protein [Chloroflexi bacterium]|nr:ABC transporter ATP-binding protein [Chloroflexota bacterium]
MTLLPKPLVEVNAISRNFGGLKAVNQVSFAIQSGEIFGLIGPNGAGKTTLFNMMTGLTPPSSGQVLYEGQDIARLSPHRIAQRGIARTFQNIRLFGNLDALQNVLIARHIHMHSNLWASMLGLPGARTEERQARIRALELLDLVGLADRANETANSLPYGDQRRLEIARALALEPRLLLLDEPAAGMNPNEKQVLSDFIRQIHAEFKLTVLLIEHHVPLVMGLADRIAVLNFGQLIAIGDPAQVKSDPVVIEAYLGEEV